MHYEEKIFLTKAQNQALELIVKQLELLQTIYCELDNHEELKEVNEEAEVYLQDLLKTVKKCKQSMKSGVIVANYN